ncbi:MICROTUBULE-ASSOCIATED PROTEIN TORTIFOLIA1 [Salix viminalis]|uniref:MICROTUBULE-ASSOCIATED PROTEIN TORTIFOLIA1 n=1 Tax=Salix viminalis TaxID=40686 RepID=A0A9Q0Z7M7_SALVM|nr:MICROTUBULE-ASSOCIATED PROTEIN TORTIFOLIA1 [Salix viminalis]
MSSQTPKSGKPTKPQNQNQPTSRSSSLSTHLAMVELKQRIITSLSKLADRDTHQIALEDLHTLTQTISPDALPLLLNSLYDSLSESSNSKPSVKKESLHLLSLACQSHRDLTQPHLTKIISCIVKRLKDSDSSVRDACRDAIGVLSGLYLKGNGSGGDSNGPGPVVGLFVRPLFEAMGEQNKVVQSGAAICMEKMVECASVDRDNGGGNGPIGAFHKLCPRICKLLNGQFFQAKAALLGVVTSLSQVGSIAPQGLEPLLQSIHDCLRSTDWATRKAAADALTALALHSSSFIADGVALSTLTVLEACRFDKIKPVRDSMTEAMQLWKKIAGKGEGVPDDQKSSSQDGEHHDSAELSDKNSNPSDRKKESSSRDASNGTSPAKDSALKSKDRSIPEKAVVILKKKAHALTDKELNPEFFQKFEKRGSGDLPVEVVVPRRYLNSSNLNEEESEPNVSESRGRSNRMGNSQSDDVHGAFNKFRTMERGVAGKDLRTRAFDDERLDINQRESSGSRAGFSKSDGQSEGSFVNNKGNWLAIQRQLLQLERQQAHVMNMLQDFMGGSHNSMVTLENRVRGLERVVEDLAHDLTISSGRRGNSFAMGFEGSSSRPLGKYNGFSDYSSTKFNGRVPSGERFSQSDATAPGMRGRGTHWRSDAPDAWDFPTYGASRNGQTGSRRAPGCGSLDARSPRSEHESDQLGSRRAWDKGAGPVRHGEGPSARSVWQASKDEATLEAIRVAGEDSGLARTARAAIPEMTAEALGDDNFGQERDPIWTSWINAMDALKMGDVDTAYAEVVSTEDDLLLVKLMDKSGPVVDQLSNETACEVLNAIGQFLMEQNLFDICLSWIQQLAEIVLENGSDVFGIPMDLKKDLLLNLHEASTSMEPSEDWEGAAPDQLLLQLASAWGIEIQQFEK